MQTGNARVHSWVLDKIHWLLKRKATEIFLRTPAPRMMIKIRQGLKRISRCSLGIMKLCLSFFLWLYQFIMMWNKQDERNAVEHNYFEGEISFVSICGKIVWSKLNFSNISEFDVVNDISPFFLPSNLCLQIIVKLTFHASFLIFKYGELITSYSRLIIYIYIESSVWRALGLETQSYRESMRHL